MGFVESLSLKRILPCLAQPGRIIVVATPSRPLDGLLPLLNAVVPSVASYNPVAGVMTVRRRPGLITLYSDEVFITQVRDTEEGLELLAALRDLLNQVWERREEIVPRPEGRQTARPLDVYALLPGTNCQACGEATCMAFAFGLLLGRHRPPNCPSLEEPQQAALSALLGNVGEHPHVLEEA